jgi:DNA polymerase-4
MKAICRDCLWTSEGATTALRRLQLDARVLRHPSWTSCRSPTSTATPSTPRWRSATAPELRDLPVIVGGGVRGVVSTCCYIARMSGVRSAMPMFKALKACPDAVVIKPDFTKYTFESRRIMAMMRDLTPLVQPLSLDEAWMDLSGSERLHGGPPP